ncbi:FYVE-domain-containing protein [Lichtheimia hyalospora FSU 10163]|nr:FYVE-domain-containing protein [Lichtheimia hyalospora FSU 10163]
MMIIHENQRSSSLLGLSRPQFSAAALTKREHEDRGPWSSHPYGIPTSKETVSLPQSTNSRIPGASNWFWLTDWQIDYSDPRVDPTSGWQYARSFDDADHVWTPVAPTSGYGWVRRRRWVRVMKRRMDLVKGNLREDDDDTNLPNDATMYVELQKDYLEQAEELVQNAKDDNNEATTTTESTDVTARTIRKLTSELRVYEEAIQMLLAGIKTDTNQFRKHQATILVKSHTAHTESLNARITALGSKLSTPVGPIQHNPELARELGFTSGNNNNGALNDLQATTSTTHQRSEHQTIGYIDGSSTGMVATDFDANPWSRDSGNSEVQPTWVSVHDQQQHENSSLNHVDLLGHDDNNNNDDTLAVSGYNDEPEDQGLRAFEWEADINAKECRRCARRFGILVRRHHCRRCGLIVCDRCSASRTYLNASEILQDPNGPRESVQVLATQHHRVCDKCYADLGLSRA